MRILKQSDPGPENSSRQSAPSSRFHGSPLPDEFSWSSGDNEESLQLIAGRFGDRVDAAGFFAGIGFAQIIGHSVCGAPLTALSVGTGPRRLLVTAAHHANEWITAPALMVFIEDLLFAGDSGGSVGGVPARDILSRSRITFVPLVNPDGVDLVNGTLPSAGVAQASAIAENWPDIPFPSGWKANIRGVDLNLQYPALWETARENKSALGVTGPAPQNYVGPKPLSEPESRALFDLTLREDPDLVLAFHTQGETIYWRFFDRDIPGSRELGERLSHESGYSLEDTPYVSGFAGYKDWFIDAFRRPGYTVEFGRGTNPLPPDQFGRIRETCAKIIAAAAMGI